MKQTSHFSMMLFSPKIPLLLKKPFFTLKNCSKNSFLDHPYTILS